MKTRSSETQQRRNAAAAAAKEAARIKAAEYAARVAAIRSTINNESEQ